MSNAERQELLREAMSSMSLSELVLRLRISLSTLEEWISGQTPIPDDVTFVLIAVVDNAIRTSPMPVSSFRNQQTPAVKQKQSKKRHRKKFSH